MISGILNFLHRMIPGIFAAAFVYACLFPIRKARLKRLNLTSSLTREIALLIFFLFCGGMAVLTLLPRWFDWVALIHGDLSGFPAFFQFGTTNLILFRTFSGGSWSMMILFGNIIMFLPIGFFVPLLWRKVSVSKTVLCAVLTPLFIESFQLFVGRAFDIDDLILNAFGILLGSLFCRLLQRCFPKAFHILHANPS